MDSREILVLVIRTPKGQEGNWNSQAKGIESGQYSEGQTTGDCVIQMDHAVLFLLFDRRRLLKKEEQKWNWKPHYMMHMWKPEERLCRSVVICCIYYDKVMVIWFLIYNQIIHCTAILIAHRAISCLTVYHIVKIVRQNHLKILECIFSFTQHFTHVRYIK